MSKTTLHGWRRISCCSRCSSKVGRDRIGAVGGEEGVVEEGGREPSGGWRVRGDEVGFGGAVREGGGIGGG